jgi:hypothetical protein
VNAIKLVEFAKQDLQSFLKTLYLNKLMYFVLKLHVIVPKMDNLYQLQLQQKLKA